MTMVTPHFLSSRTGMLNTTKYSKSIKNGKFPIYFNTLLTQ